MNKFEERTEELNTLLGLDLKVTRHQDALIFVGQVITWTLSNRTEVLLEKSNFLTLSGYLYALEWIGTKAKVVFE